MGTSLELRKSSSYQHNPKVERIPLPRPKRSPFPEVPDKLKTTRAFQPHSDLIGSSRKEIVRGKSSVNLQGKSVKGSPTGDDELVRHMTNLPGYLLGAERGENLQEKALSVGVLDWSRLESWKHKQMSGPIRAKTDTPRSRSHASSKQITGISTFSPVVHSETSAKPQSGSIAAHKAEHSHFATSVRNAIHSQDPDIGSKSAMKEKQKVERIRTSSGRSSSNIIHERESSKRSDRRISSETVNISSHVRHSGVIPNGSPHVLDGKANNRTEKLIKTDIQNKDEHERVILEIGQLPSKLSYDISSSSNDCMGVENKETKKSEKHCADIDLPYQYFGYKQDVNRLLKQKPRNLEEEFQPSYARSSFDENVTDMNSSSYSEIFSPEGFLSSECGSEIPYSCPLPTLADTDAMMGTMQDCLVSNNSEHSSSSYSHPIPNLGSSEGKRSENGKPDNKVAHSEFVDSLQSMDNETTEPGARKGRHPSPNRRFSFSLGRMGRSFSFKESSMAVPQLSSTYISPKSGPVISETVHADNSDKKKVNGHNRTRSSPLRRLIEPILKHKSSNSQHSLEGNFRSLSFWPSGLGSAPQKKQAASTMQALLQFTIKNGLPLFKLLVDNNRNVLAATIKDLVSSAKNESGQNYTFYLVNEIKRKNGGWIRPENREKSYGYAYNVIGQMKVKSDFKTREHNTDSKYVFRESVLFGVEMRPADRESAIIVKNRELAAVIFKIPIEKLNHDGQQNDKVPVANSMKSLSEDDAVVILPGAVHGSPSSGEPSPLINRWRSGGLCDCGGWDVGCKLRVLSIPNKLITSKTYPIPYRFELLVEGEGQQNKPVFSLAPLKGGFFEVHFDSSISMLQAFFICVAVLNGQKPADLSEASKCAPEEKMFKYPNPNGPRTISEKGPASVRYAPNPPLSPVGRV